MLLRMLAIASTLFMLAGCATLTKPESRACFAGPVDADGRPRVTVFFATDRQPGSSRDAFPEFGFARADTLVFGKVEVTLPADRDRPFGAVSPGFRIEGASLLEGENAFAGALRREVAARPNPRSKSQGLVFVHGYNESFDRVAFRTAQIVHDGCLSVVPIMFSWPSRDTLVDYGYDLESATFAQPALAQLLRLVAHHADFARTHIMAHSMGNKILLEALRLLRPELRSLLKVTSSPPFGALILASPDIDLDILRQGLPIAMDSARSVTLFTSKNDFLLAVASLLAHDSSRAGNATQFDLDQHGVSGHGNFSVVRMDGPEIGACEGGSHRCAETSPIVLARIREILLRAAGMAGITPPELTSAISP